MNILDACNQNNINTDHHCSDLYIEQSEEATALIEQHCPTETRKTITTFISEIDNNAWYEIPFAYYPYYENK